MLNPFQFQKDFLNEKPIPDYQNQKRTYYRAFTHNPNILYARMSLFGNRVCVGFMKLQLGHEFGFLSMTSVYKRWTLDTTQWYGKAMKHQEKRSINQGSQMLVFFPSTCRRSLLLGTPEVQTFGLHTKFIQFLLYKLPGVWDLLAVVPGN